MDRIELTEQDLIEAILAAQSAEGPSGASTTAELAERTGMSLERVRARLHKLAGEGRLEVCHVLRRALDGKMQPLPAYRMKQQN